MEGLVPTPPGMFESFYKLLYQTLNISRILVYICNSVGLVEPLLFSLQASPFGETTDEHYLLQANCENSGQQVGSGRMDWAGHNFDIFPRSGSHWNLIRPHTSFDYVPLNQLIRDLLNYPIFQIMINQNLQILLSLLFKRVQRLTTHK